MARGIAVAALVAFETGVVSGVVVTTALAIRSKGCCSSMVGLSLDILELEGPSGDRPPRGWLQRPPQQVTGRELYPREIPLLGE